MENVKRILVLCRMTPYCGAAITTGVSLARNLGAELFVIRLLTGPLNVGAVNAPRLFPSDSKRNEHQSIEQEAKEELDRVIRSEVGRGVPIKELVGSGSPVDDIANAVKEHHIDLLVMLGHAESRLEHYLFGGDNHAILRRLPCSILLVKKEPEAVH